MIKGGYYRDKYFEEYCDYLREKTDEERTRIGKKCYTDVTIKTLATDTFYLEKHEDVDFKNWLQSDETIEKARLALIKHFTGKRNNPEKDAKYYVERMLDFKKFLNQRI